MKNVITTITILATMSVAGTSQACEVQVERQFAENAVTIRTGKPTAGMVIVSFNNPVFTGVVENTNKYVGDMVVEWPGTNSTQTLQGMELRGRCKVSAKIN